MKFTGRCSTYDRRRFKKKYIKRSYFAKNCVPETPNKAQSLYFVDLLTTGKWNFGKFFHSRIKFSAKIPNFCKKKNNNFREIAKVIVC